MMVRSVSYLKQIPKSEDKRDYVDKGLKILRLDHKPSDTLPLESLEEIAKNASKGATHFQIGEARLAMDEGHDAKIGCPSYFEALFYPIHYWSKNNT